MKKLLLSVSLLATSLVASAQFNVNSSTEGWSGIRFSYAPTTLKYDKDYDIDNETLNGFSLEYFSDFNIIESIPLFLEIGAGLEWLTYSDSETESAYGVAVKVKSTDNIFTVNIPVNLGYKFSVNENASIMPYVGLKARLGLSATSKITAKVTYDGETEKESETYNLFSEDDMGDFTMKRFLIGWQVGATAIFNQFTIGVNYGACFTDEVINDIDSRLGAVTISVGYIF